VAEGVAVALKQGRTPAETASFPLVSVVIPAYNCAAYIDEAIESVYRQTYLHWEIVLVDDGSTDGTASVVGAHGERVRYFAQANRGTAAARNAGVRWARGELIAFLDNDDVWLPISRRDLRRASSPTPTTSLPMRSSRR
jgi:GT2 family glycosyltransferase